MNIFWKHPKYYGVIAITMLIFCAHSVFAKDPDFLVSWEAQTTIPQGYSGKAYPTEGADIRIGFEVIKDGKIIDISKQEVRWYIGTKMITKGIGMQSIILKNNEFSGNDILMKFSVNLYDEEEGGFSFVEKRFNIPVVEPQVVIENSLFSKNISTNSKIFLNAKPFFFKSQNLRIQWAVNGSSISKEENQSASFILDTGNVASGSRVNAKATITNIENKGDSASKRIDLYIQ